MSEQKKRNRPLIVLRVVIAITEHLIVLSLFICLFICSCVLFYINAHAKMNRNLHSPTKLTEFARDFDIEPDTFFAKFVNKITNVYNSGYNTVNVVPARQNFLHG